MHPLAGIFHCVNRNLMDRYCLRTDKIGLQGQPDYCDYCVASPCTISLLWWWGCEVGNAIRFRVLLDAISL